MATKVIYGLSMSDDLRHIRNARSPGACYGVCGTCAPWIVDKGSAAYSVCRKCLRTKPKEARDG